MAVGTPDYISPEQARLVKLDGRSDLYSLGCTIYHLLSGQLPFKGESSMDCIVGRITGKAVPITDVRPGLPPRLVESIEKMMATNPDDRYQTADEAAAAMRSMLRPKKAPPESSATAVAANASVPKPVPAVAANASVPKPVPAVAANASAPKPVPAVAANASVPEPVPKGRTTPEAPSPPVLSRVHLSKSKRDSLRSRWTTGPWSSRCCRSRVGLTARPHDHAFQVIGGRTSGIPAGGLTHERRPRPPGRRGRSSTV